MNKTESFWDRAAAKYARSPIKDMEAYEKTLARVRANLKADDHVLEVGCGTGSTALLLADAVREITASDVSSAMIEIAKGKAADQKIANVTFVHATPFDDALGATAYDAVLAFNLLHLLEDLPAAIRRLRDLVGPGGLFISKTPCLSEKKGFLRPVISLMRLFGAASYVNFFSIKTLEEEIAKAGFDIVETGDYPPSAPSRFIVARKV